MHRQCRANISRELQKLQAENEQLKKALERTKAEYDAMAVILWRTTKLSLSTESPLKYGNALAHS